jgi:hypothetical protein
MLNVFMQSGIYAACRHAECRGAPFLISIIAFVYYLDVTS